MTKSIKQQYIDLKEGNLSKSQFMRNVRMNLPQYITNVTSFDDTIKILRNKAILTESDIKSPNFSEINTLNAQEVFIGMRYEMQNNALDKEKATKIVIKNLKKNSNYYTALNMSGSKGSKIEYMNKFKPGSDQMTPVKGNELVDKNNKMSSPKGIDVVKASANKASKETNKPESGINMMSLIAKSIRGLQKMTPTGEKMKKINLKESLGIEELNNIADEVYTELGNMNSHDSNDRYNLIKQYDLSPEDIQEIEAILFDKMADERYDSEYDLNEIKVNSLKVGDSVTLQSDLGKFVKGEEVTIKSIKPFGDDFQIILSNGKDTDDFYIDKNDEI